MNSDITSGNERVGAKAMNGSIRLFFSYADALRLFIWLSCVLWLGIWVGTGLFQRFADLFWPFSSLLGLAAGIHLITCQALMHKLRKLKPFLRFLAGGELGLLTGIVVFVSIQPYNSLTLTWLVACLAGLVSCWFFSKLYGNTGEFSDELVDQEHIRKIFLMGACVEIAIASLIPGAILVSSLVFF